MAINYVISYTFSPGTTISSSQVNTNFSDNANTWTGLEGLTKSFSNLRVDATPTTATDVAIKSYVDHYSAYRRPVLKYGSATTVSVESGLDGTAGDIPIVFPDGSIRTETSTTRTTFDITRNAVLVTSGAQSGLTGATSEANNTWYALYACKVTDSSTLWCTVGSTVLPLRANFATLNTAYGTNGWVYLGMVRNGDNSGTIGDILVFAQSGSLTMFNNSATATSVTNVLSGILLADTGSATTLTYTYASGTGTAQIPAHLTIGNYVVTSAAFAASLICKDSGNAREYFRVASNTSPTLVSYWSPLTEGVQLSNSAGGATAYDIFIRGFTDSVLGVGSNPML